MFLKMDFYFSLGGLILKAVKIVFFTEKRLLQIQRENGKAYEITEDYQHLWPLIVGLGSEIIMHIMTKYL